MLLIPLLACSGAPDPEPGPPPPPVEEATPEDAEPPRVAPDFTPPAELAPDPRAALRDPPEGFVDLSTFIPGIRVDARYHSADNFTGAPLPGYGAPGAWMLRTTAEALARAQASLEPQGYALLVYDAYRPLRGTLAMVAWAERTDQVHLLDQGYIARRSRHNHGHTVDLTLVDAESGEPLDMGTPWDTLSPASHTRNAEGAVLKRRMLLRSEMEAQGFRAYSKEWWHFRMDLDGTRSRDVPYGCFEADEGAWRPPEGWSEPDWRAPSSWPEVTCETLDLEATRPDGTEPSPP